MDTKLIKHATAWAAAALLALPVVAEGQQDPTLVADGAQVYSVTCGRCHNARPGAERTDREWVVIVAHMRARANLPRSKADAVLAFLQATNAPETAVAAPPQRPQRPSSEGATSDKPGPGRAGSDQ